MKVVMTILFVVAFIAVCVWLVLLAWCVGGWIGMQLQELSWWLHDRRMAKLRQKYGPKGK